MNSEHKVVHEDEEYERIGWDGVNLGVWQSPSLVRKISVKAGKKPEDYYWYHRKVTEWVAANVCPSCNEHRADHVCHCENDE